MKYNILLLIIFSAFAFGCSNNDPQSRLDSLRKEREAIDLQITQLEKELGANTDAQHQKRIPIVKIQQVKPTLFQHFIDIQGNVKSDKNILIPVEASGVTTRILVKEGDKVRKGQLLAQIDASIMERSIDEVKNALDLATLVFEKQKRLWDQKIGSEIQYLQTKNQKEALEKKLLTLQEQLEKTRIKSPLNGHIDEIFLKEGELAAPGMGAIRVVQLADLKINAAVAENYISSIHTADPVTVNVPLLSQSFNSQINAIARVINPDNRTFSIEVNVPTDIKDIKPNMLAVIRVNDYRNENALIVPLNVVQNSGEEYFLFVASKKGDKWYASKRMITPGHYNQSEFEITDNLKAGEFIITVGYSELADKQEINPGKL